MKIDKNEVLRYLGYKNQKISAELDQKIDFLVADAKKTLKPKAFFEIFEPEFEDVIYLKETSLVLRGKSILNHLNGAEKVAVMAVTLGIEAERTILKYQHTDMVSTVISDAVFDAFVETVADEIQQKIEEKAKAEGLFISSRFSPGYGDLPLETQQDIISCLSLGKRIGLTVTESNILVPRKSITAIVGLFKEEQKFKKTGCETCNLKDKCKSKKEQIKCLKENL